MYKRFDITKYKWSDKDLSCQRGDNNSLDMELSYRGQTPVVFGISERDAIAIAKSFGLILDPVADISHFKPIPQSETTYIERPAIIMAAPKEGDLHG